MPNPQNIWNCRIRVYVPLLFSHSLFLTHIILGCLLTIVQNPEGILRYVGYPLSLFEELPGGGPGEDIELQEMPRIMSWSCNPEMPEDEEVSLGAVDKALDYLTYGEEEAEW